MLQDRVVQHPVGVCPQALSGEREWRHENVQTIEFYSRFGNVYVGLSAQPTRYIMSLVLSSLKKLERTSRLGLLIK